MTTFDTMDAIRRLTAAFEGKFPEERQYLRDYLHGHTNFGAKVYELLAKADDRNQQRIAVAWPNHFAVWTIWNALPREAAAYFVGTDAGTRP